MHHHPHPHGIIAWPALIAFSGDAELLRVRDQAHWDDDPHLHAEHYHPADRLIDADGNAYRLTRREQGRVVPAANGERLALQDVLQMVRRHAAQEGACCAAKLSAASVREAIALLQ